MDPIRHILVATDFGAASERATDTAVGFAERFGAKLTLLHVFELVYPYPVPPPPELRIDAQRDLDAAAAKLRARGVQVATMMREGEEAWREIVEAATASHADLVIVGSHGRRGLPRFMLGSVAEKVVRVAPMPVLTVHGPLHGEPVHVPA